MKLPTRITPCPIVEAGMEVRFTPGEPWQVMPGLLFADVRERYPHQESLPVAQIPEEIREQDPHLRSQALVRFKAADGWFLQLGPRSLTLISSGHEYPGWTAFRGQMEWLLPRLGKLGFMRDVHRVGLRYIDFFEGNATPHLRVRFIVAEEELTDREVAFTTVLEREGFRLRLNINNRGLLHTGRKPRHGTILDLDTWIDGENLDLPAKGLVYFNQAHRLQKTLFYDLLEPAFLQTLRPEYL